MVGLLLSDDLEVTANPSDYEEKGVGILTNDRNSKWQYIRKLIP